MRPNHPMGTCDREEFRAVLRLVLGFLLIILATLAGAMEQYPEWLTGLLLMFGMVLCAHFERPVYASAWIGEQHREGDAAPSREGDVARRIKQ